MNNPAYCTTTPPPSTKFIINDRVQATASVQVRSTPAGESQGTQSTGMLGTVVGGPTYAALSGVNYWWWNVNFDSGLDGWVAEDFLLKVVDTPTPPPDTTVPTVSITSPSSGSTVSGTITVSANATDNVGVAGVQFKLDGNSLGSEDISSPYSTSWNTSVSTGSHTLTATARDAAGNTTTSSSVTVTIQSSTPTPTPICVFTRDLYLKSRGEDVRCLQKYLNSTGFIVSSSGIGSPGNESDSFGSATQYAVSRWQKIYTIRPNNGYFGSKSRAKYLELTR